MAKQNDSPMMKQFRDLKAKHPDVLLLFRCGDFYETYEDDARECAKVLGITLTIRQSDNMPMVGFPYHALDAYLPKLIRTGHRVSIYDQLDPPPGPRRKRGETIDNNSSTNQNNSEAMKQEMKVADLIGKSVCNGNAKYVIKSVDGDKVKVDFAMGDNAAKEMTMKAEQIEKLLQGGWTVGEGTAAAQEAPKAEEPNDKEVKIERRKVTLKKKQPQSEAKTEEPKQEQAKVGSYTFKTYTRPTKSGGTKTLGRIDGLQEGDELLERGVAEKLHASPMYDKVGDKKVWWLSFGKRYVDAAAEVCQALNDGRSLEDCVAIVDAQTEENHAQSEAYRKKNEERRAAKQQGKVYTEAEVADLMRRVIAGDKEALSIVNAMAA
ncbi:MAG: hypothetical protein J6M41_08730 [Prevotella sp.]|nr:hypothetical protein [Prevotella sp.]